MSSFPIFSTVPNLFMMIHHILLFSGTSYIIGSFDLKCIERTSDLNPNTLFPSPLISDKNLANCIKREEARSIAPNRLDGLHGNTPSFAI